MDERRTARGAVRFQAVCFDLDGTLLDSFPAIEESMRHVVNTYLPEQPQLVDRGMAMVGRLLAEIMDELAQGDEERAAAMTAAYRIHNHNLLAQIPFFPGVPAALAELRRLGLALGLVTSKSRKATLVSLEVHGLSQAFDVVITGDDVSFHKPHPQPLLDACQALNVEAALAAYVGDADVDMLCAEAAGCVGMAALWGTQDRSALLANSPPIQLESIADVLVAVKATDSY